jgi:hypothetical protein
VEGHDGIECKTSLNERENFISGDGMKRRLTGK